MICFVVRSKETRGLSQRFVKRCDSFRSLRSRASNTARFGSFALPTTQSAASCARYIIRDTYEPARSHSIDREWRKIATSRVARPHRTLHGQDLRPIRTQERFSLLSIADIYPRRWVNNLNCIIAKCNCTWRVCNRTYDQPRITNTSAALACLVHVRARVHATRIVICISHVYTYTDRSRCHGITSFVG